MSVCTSSGLYMTLALLGALAVAPASVASGPPVASDDLAFHVGGTVMAIDVLANDTEPDGEAVQVLGLGTTCSIVPGSLDVDFGLVTLTPVAGAPESCTITYHLRDESNNDSSTATVDIDASGGVIFRDDCELGDDSRWDDNVEEP